MQLFYALYTNLQKESYTTFTNNSCNRSGPKNIDFERKTAIWNIALCQQYGRNPRIENHGKTWNDGLLAHGL